jgi:hypothetical protein
MTGVAVLARLDVIDRHRQRSARIILDVAGVAILGRAFENAAQMTVVAANVFALVGASEGELGRQVIEYDTASLSPSAAGEAEQNGEQQPAQQRRSAIEQRRLGLAAQPSHSGFNWHAVHGVP